MIKQIAYNTALDVRKNPLSPSILLENFNTPSNQNIQSELNLKAVIYRYFSILKDGMQTIIWVTLLFMILATVTGVLTNSTYTSKATLRINIDPTQYLEYKVDTKRQPGFVNDKVFYNTESRILRSRALAKKVISDLNIKDALLEERKYKDIVYLAAVPFKTIVKFIKEIVSPSSNNSVKLQGITADDVFLDKLTILPVQSSRIIDIKYKSNNPERAKKVLEKLILNYKLIKSSGKESVTKDASEIIDNQIKKAKKSLYDAERNLINYAKSNEIIDFTSDKSILSSNLEALNIAYIKALNKRITIQQSFSLKRNASSDSRILTDPVIRAHKTELTKLRALHDSSSKQFKAKHPSMRGIIARIRGLENEIASEFNTIKKNENEIFESSLRAAEEVEADIKAKIEEYEGKLLKFHDSNIEFSNLQREVETSKAIFTGLLKRLKEINIIAPIKDDNIIIIDVPELPHQKDSPRIKKFLILGLLIGLFLSVISVLMKEILSPLIRSSDDIEALSKHHRVLATLPKIKTKTSVINLSKDSEMIRHFQSIYTSMPLQNQFPKCLHVTSTTKNEGKTAVAVNLAVSIARLHKKVLLIDTNLRDPKIHEYFKLDNKHGLSDFLEGNKKKILKTVIKEKLFVITTGMDKQDPMTVLSNPKFIKFLEVSSNMFDHIIIDSSSILDSSESRIIANISPATLVVVGEKKVYKKQIEETISLLDSAGATLVGFVNNMSTSKNNT